MPHNHSNPNLNRWAPYPIQEVTPTEHPGPQAPKAPRAMEPLPGSSDLGYPAHSPCFAVIKSLCTLEPPSCILKMGFWGSTPQDDGRHNGMVPGMGKATHPGRWWRTPALVSFSVLGLLRTRPHQAPRLQAPMMSASQGCRSSTRQHLQKRVFSQSWRTSRRKRRGLPGLPLRRVCPVPPLSCQSLPP